MPSFCDYEGSEYRTTFWEGQGRDYEDRAERVALRRLLPLTGRRLLEVGAGFGRLTDEFAGYEQVILLDYSRSLLEEARAHLGTDDRYVYVAASIYQSPIADASCDAAVMIRVIHHLADAPAALQQVRTALQPGSTFVLEFANKRNLKAMVRHLLRQQQWSPYSREPVEFVELNFDFHPQSIAEALHNAGFEVQRRLAVSYLRMGLLKRMFPTRFLVGLDSLLQWTGTVANFSPSVFTQSRVLGQSPAATYDGPVFKCPSCGNSLLRDAGDHLTCDGCGKQWAVCDGIYDFRGSVS